MVARSVQLSVIVLGLLLGSASAQELVTVDRHVKPSTVVLRDAVVGAISGVAVSGGLILYEKAIADNAGFASGRTLAWGVVIGLATGLACGIIDATAGPGKAQRPEVTQQAQQLPVRDELSRSMDLTTLEPERRAVIVPVLTGRF